MSTKEPAMTCYDGSSYALYSDANSLQIRENIQPLKVVIVGAGIGGLGVAIALRRAGHKVELYEKSVLAKEAGAAVHLAPNSNGILRRWGLFAEDFGANLANRVKEFHYSGHVLKDMDLTQANAMWQHPWQLVHRAALHSSLKEMATSTAGTIPGYPVQLHTSSRAVGVKPEDGTVVLENGDAVQADLVVGADGIYSTCREVVSSNSPRPFSSGKAAFRFLIATRSVEDDPETAHLVAKDTLCIWFGDDRRIVAYPCNNNEMLNFACIHPDSESHTTASDGWNKSASLEQILHVYRDFDPSLLKLFRKVPPEELKVWQLLDMDEMPHWTKGKLALLGDAAHPFTPHQGQGAGQALEDSAALATVLPLGTTPSEVPERLKLYESIRASRAHRIQDYSRQAGKDCVDGKPQLNMMAYTNYNFGHDEYDHASNVFRRWLWNRKFNASWQMPMPLWPAVAADRETVPDSSMMVADFSFNTSKTFLETLLPNDSFKFKSPATVCRARLSVTTFHQAPWLGGRSYSNLGLYLEGVQYVSRDGLETDGSYLLLFLENILDTVTPGREDVGVPRLLCDLDVSFDSTRYRLEGSWNGTNFMSMTFSDLGESTTDKQGKVSDGINNGILAYRYVPAVWKPTVADAEYPLLISSDQLIKVTRTFATQKATVKFDAGDGTSLPTLHHVISVLSMIPILSVNNAEVREGYGTPQKASCRRLD